MKVIKRGVSCFGMCLVVLNGILISSAPLNMIKEEVFYVNCTMIGIGLFHLFWSFISWRAGDRQIQQLLLTDQIITKDDIKGRDYLSDKIREIVQFNQEIHDDERRNLFRSIDEMDDYITKWVHEIKLPISICELVIDRCSLEQREDEFTQEYNKIQGQIKRIDSLVEQVMFLNRANSFQENITVSNVNLELLLKKILRKESDMFIEKDIEINFYDLDNKITTDVKWLSYIITQILSNSVKYSSSGSKVEIWGLEDNNNICIKVKDFGCGISGKNIDRIFDKGFTGDEGLNITKSTGMGLYIAKKMGDKLGYEFEVDSKLGEYTEVTIKMNKYLEYLGTV